MKKIYIGLFYLVLGLSMACHARPVGTDQSISLSPAALELVKKMLWESKTVMQAIEEAKAQALLEWSKLRWFRAPSETEQQNWLDNKVLELIAEKFGGSILQVPMPQHNPFASER